MAAVVLSQIGCEHCLYRLSYFAQSLDTDELSDLEAHLSPFRATQSKEFLGRAGDAFEA